MAFKLLIDISFNQLERFEAIVLPSSHCKWTNKQHLLHRYLGLCLKTVNEGTRIRIHIPSITECVSISHILYFLSQSVHLHLLSCSKERHVLCWLSFWLGKKGRMK